MWKKSEIPMMLLDEVLNLKKAYLEIFKEYGIIKSELENIKKQLNESHVTKETLEDTLDKMIKDQESYRTKKTKLDLMNKPDDYDGPELDISDLSGSL